MYRFGDLLDYPGKFPAQLDFSAVSIDDGQGGSINFWSQSGGNLRLTSYGRQPGDRIAGDFDCSVIGYRFVKETGKNVAVTGTINGTLDVRFDPP